ncbi:MAG: hypothetical protein COB93_00615 [Sneathiella sp.]|nr:MAG: hypothetical protein COB93_00615 [Sneathiella sp.]
MTTKDYVRLRQICLATLDIKSAEAAVSGILGLNVCHRSTLKEFGLENIMFPVNGTFIEIVAPTAPNTAVHRFLARNENRGGYMAIFDCADVTRHRALAEANGVDVIYERNSEGGDLLQLNPKQTGATIMEFDHHYGGDDLLGHYEWAGKGWQDHVRTDVTKDILGIEISSPKAALRAKLWANLCNRVVVYGESDLQDITLDYGTLTFRQTAKNSRELFSAIDLTVSDRHQVLTLADQAGCPVTDNSFDFCGIEFRLRRAD